MNKSRFLVDKYGALFDGHVHTYFDYHDGMMSPIQLVKSTLKKRFNFVCAMAHDTVIGMSRIKKVAKQYNLPVLPAMEVSTIHNHILAYGVQEWPWRRDCLQPDEAIEYLREQGCAIFLAHPYSNPHEGYWTPELIKRLDIDGIEWHNATIFYQNRKTRIIYQNFPKGRRIAGSDAHHPSVFGAAFTQVKVNSDDPDDVVSAMKKGKCKAYDHTAAAHSALFMVFKAVVRNKMKRQVIEGKTIIPCGDHPGSRTPNIILTSEQWRQDFLKKPEIERNVRWIEGA